MARVVLIVDDEQLILSLELAMLEGLGCEVLSVAVALVHWTNSLLIPYRSLTDRYPDARNVSL